MFDLVMSILVPIGAIVFLLIFSRVAWILGLWYIRRDDVLQAAERRRLFEVKPYLQLGNRPTQGATEGLEVIWHTAPMPCQFSLEYKLAGARRWSKAAAPVFTNFWCRGVQHMYRYTAQIEGLPPGAEFDYRVRAHRRTMFEARGMARKGPAQPYTMAVLGDTGDHPVGPMLKVAHRVWESKPDFVMVAGDLVYHKGRANEYISNLWPVYNADRSDPGKGAPIMRSRLLLTAFGNHDSGTPDYGMVRDAERMPDLLGYYLFLSQPLNGPLTKAGAPCTPVIEKGDGSTIMSLAGSRYPAMANFSFDYANSHWTVLDANRYMDWSDEALVAWVKADLEKAREKTWRFVCFHQPPFISDKKHSGEQLMRQLAPVFEEYKVDVVFCGHVHTYERTRPLRFQPVMDPEEHYEWGPIEGVFTIDEKFDGVTNTRPDGVIYLVTGAAGGDFDPAHRPQEGELKPYTATYNQDIHSFTSCRVDGGKLTISQISEDGEQFDSITIEK